MHTMKQAKHRAGGRAAVLAAAILLAASAAGAQPKLEVLLPLGRTAYQTNEAIHLAVVRGADEALPAGDLVLTVAGEDASRMSFTLPVPAVPLAGKDARATEHVYLNGWLLRPGRYAVEVSADGAAATADIEVYGHVRRSSYKLIVWGRAKGPDQLVEGEDGMGFNLIYAVYNDDKEAHFLRAGADYMKCCTMGGAHQMDMRTECDWSDPYVTRGGVVRAVRRALIDRTRPNAVGVHFYDEPGLTYHNHPTTGEWTPHGIPSQMRSYEGAFGRRPVQEQYHKLDPNDPQQVVRWRHFAYWKLGFMDAAWKLAQFGVSYVRPDFLSVNQSQYGWTAFTDGYYFNVVRSLPVTSGHGGYHDYGLYLFNPSYFLEMALARDRAKPCWYLPCWYGSTTSEQFRLEQNLCFAMGIQGLQTPPDIDPFRPETKPAAEAVVETNRIAARLGTIFSRVAPTHPQVAALYSLSHVLHAQTLDRSMNYAHADRHGRMLPLVYLAGTTIQQPIAGLVEEDVLDGTLIARHKAVILAGIDHLDEPVIAALEAFRRYGGRVLMTGDCRVKVAGAINLGVVPKVPGEAEAPRLRERLQPLQARMTELRKQLKKDPKNADLAGQIDALKQQADKINAEIRSLTSLGRQLDAVGPLAAAIRKHLDEAGIRAVFECDQPGIVARRHVAGDVEYLFAVNASTDRAGESLNTRAAVATISLPIDAGDRRPIYDAVRGGPAWEFARKDGKLVGRFRFGPGQMRVFARPMALPIGVVVHTPVVRRDYTLRDAPLAVEVGASLAVGGVSGSVPLRVRVFGPAGIRHDVYRATEVGALRLSLPLGVNDPPGTWAVFVTNLLTNHEGSASFEHYVPPHCGAVAGRKTRAVHFGRDRDNIFRFFRVHRAATIVTGSSDYNAPAADRLVRILKPWDVACTIVPAAEAGKCRQVPPEAVGTWVGLQPSRLSEKNPGRPEQVGFAVSGAVILLGTPQDNAVLAYLLKEGFLPYEPKADVFPGRGRGLIAWQRDGVGHGQESIALIAHDADGMAEAVGTMYEAMAGVEPLTPWELPTDSRIVPAGKSDAPARPKVLWQAVLPDRAVGMAVQDGRLTVLTRDESTSAIDAKGQAAAPKPLDADEYAAQAEQMRPRPDEAAMKLARDHPVVGRIPKHAAACEGLSAVGYWGGLLRVLDAEGGVKAAWQFQDDITGVVWLGETLVVGLSDGRVVGMSVK